MSFAKSLASLTSLPACRRLLFPLLHAEKVPFPRATKEIGNVCTQAITSYYAKLGDSAYVRKVPERNEGVGCHAPPPVPPPPVMPVYGKLISGMKIGSFW